MRKKEVAPGWRCQAYSGRMEDPMPTHRPDPQVGPVAQSEEHAPHRATSALLQHARDLVRKHFPEADAAFLGGSTAAGTATATSDLDIAILRPAGHETFRNTTRADDGRIVEWFVHTPETVNTFLDEANRRATMAHIYGQSIVLVNKAGAADEVATRARAILQSGPARRDAQELEALRYALTDAYDDLTDTKYSHDSHDQLAVASIEQLAVAGTVVQKAADLLCELRGAWTGRGKWLPRRVRQADAELGHALMDSWLTLARSGDAAPLLAIVGAIINEAGGPLREGFRRTAPPA